MTKRKLSRQQRWRIEKVQAERNERANKRNSQLNQALSEGELGPEQNGLIVSHFGQQVEVESDVGLRQRCHVRAHIENLVTGDSVTWREGKPTGVVVARNDRHSLLSRPDNHGKLKPVAANIDHIVIVIAPEPRAHANLIDRYLVASEAIGISPILLLNKSDLINADNQAYLDSMLARYQEIGYSVTRASTAAEHGLDQLKQTLSGQISVFVGQSGVGKSSLVNSLLPGTDTRIGALSESTAKGKHTTTTARLYHFPDGGSLIDSPGIREFALWNMDREKVLAGFIEFRPFLGLCRFRDCKHEHEPQCALLDAEAENKISPERMASYRQIIQSLNTD
ncbi:Small ribosomal subunit biogenesis GTPase RsgA [Zhongshania aliphaticivorans]|uniref:Small ribosomal subunit biogenesis GTPase RsgA n=1 Tax=Zhongshania aliphaticivorans TaxID=1470434 RepID=A0A5S9N9G5_9GAMM|nr:small ribosomal subunit biogenesis GTPase RsgA [Zhongshania aliphaticivorans]CAA0081830.1 Small ribosomal subunit biogenesis GTPase RsgA [Zhongshania aliphaticivorans]CAA0084729.1 Small ribosomal subunit biogenesis GTPase RsgA [Zhongshania aliphaticivorans]